MRAILALAVTVGLLVGCGNKGPLYLPKPQPTPTQPASSADAAKQTPPAGDSGK